MREVHERFARWLDWRGLSQSQAAELLGCSQVYVSLLRSGERDAGMGTAFDIEAASEGWPEGPISASEWRKPKPDEAPDAA